MEQITKWIICGSLFFSLIPGCAVEKNYNVTDNNSLEQNLTSSQVEIKPSRVELAKGGSLNLVLYLHSESGEELRPPPTPSHHANPLTYHAEWCTHLPAGFLTSSRSSSLSSSPPPEPPPSSPVRHRCLGATRAVGAHNHLPAVLVAALHESKPHTAPSWGW